MQHRATRRKALNFVVGAHECLPGRPKILIRLLWRSAAESSVMRRALNNSQPGQPYATQDYLDFTAADSIGECGNTTAATYWNT